MIRRIVIEQFKSFERVDLTLGHFNLFVGPNASGKSNFLDALRVLQGIGYGLTIDEILNGKPKSPIGEAWEGIRGGSGYARRTAAGHPGLGPYEHATVRFEVCTGSDDLGGDLRYQFGFDTLGGRIDSEKLTIGENPGFESSWESPGSDLAFAWIHPGGDRPDARVELWSTQPALTQLATHLESAGILQKACKQMASSLGDLQRYDFAPAVLRQYSRSSSAPRMGSLGEDFAAVVKQIRTDPNVERLFGAWLEQLTPDAIKEIQILPGALGESMFGIMQDGRQFAAPVLSDGTLRFAALAAAFFQPSMPRMMTFEEIENGVHPSRLRLVLDLMRSQSKSPAPQVFATSHSPVILDWLNEEDYPFVFLCRRNAESGATEIRTLAELLKSTPPGDVRLSDLAVEGWFEAVP